MDEIAVAVVGTAAVVTVLGRRARPAAKLAMRSRHRDGGGVGLASRNGRTCTPKSRPSVTSA